MTRAVPSPGSRLLAVSHKVWASGVAGNEAAVRRALEEASGPGVYLTQEEHVLLGCLRGLSRCGAAHPQRSDIQKIFGQALMLVSRQTPVAEVKYTGGGLRDERGRL